MALLGPITIPQGCNYTLVATITEPDHTEEVPHYKDLTGYTARFKVGAKDLSGIYIAVGDVDPVIGIGSCVVTDPIKGEITVALAPHDKAVLPTNNPVGEETQLQANNMYSISIKDTNGSWTKVVQRECFVEAEL